MIGVASPWLDAFEFGRGLHFFTVVWCTGLMAGCTLLGRRWRGTDREVVLRRLLAGSILGWQAVSVAWWQLPGNFDLQESLPLHVCDLVAWIAPLALLTGGPTLRALLYFWGIGLSTQAFITPVVDHGVCHPKYWLFFVGHSQIVGSAIYDIVVLGYRPTFRGLLRATGVGIGYVSFAFVFDLLVGANYGYVGNTLPDDPTLLDHLGPWPWRAVTLFGAATLAMGLTWIAWPIARGLASATRKKMDH